MNPVDASHMALSDAVGAVKMAEEKVSAMIGPDCENSAELTQVSAVLGCVQSKLLALEDLLNVLEEYRR